MTDNLTYLTTDEVMKILKIDSAVTLWRYIRKLKIPVLKLGRRNLFNRAKFEKWLKLQEERSEKDLRV